MNSLTEIKAKLDFTCTHEQIPAASAEADVLFQYARWLQKNNVLKQDKTVDTEIERLYRIAAENSHFKANINLQNGSMRGDFRLRGQEHLRLSQQLIDNNVATGYYFVGIFLKQGSAGLQEDPEMALRYFRKAADEGNAQAQYDIAEKLAPISIAPTVALSMRECAATQGHGIAARVLGVHLSTDGQYQEATEAFQLGVEAGDSTAASFLAKSFLGPKPDDQLHYLAQTEDLERAERYEKIWKVLYGYSYANPKVPELNEILPLPPAKLPAWDGKLQWLEERLANIPPEKPSPALIQQLAKAMVLDPATGKPMPGSPALRDASFHGPTCTAGSACPESGYWTVDSFNYERYILDVHPDTRYFKQGEILPPVACSYYRTRMWPLSPQKTPTLIYPGWKLLG
ncbi:DUF6396 domain-containing protein [Pseudomonas fluorescens]|uniref:SEL1-like repeat protein n=1 Tax=Pseudomonas TaxID=286 RepID=UPI002741DC71|nr:DUF6396 domain-containing protein [Pseudomonas sp. Pse1]